MDYKDIEIKTPAGPIILPSNDLYDFTLDLNISVISSSLVGP